MSRKKNENISNLKKSKEKTKSLTQEPKHFVDGHGDVREYYEPIKQYEINWDKIAADVREASLMVEQPKYEMDDGHLTKSQIKQIKKSAPKLSKKKTI